MHECFYCAGPITERHTEAEIRQRYHDDVRESVQRFHFTCFSTFQDRGAPVKPEVRYEVLNANTIEGSEG